MRLFLTPRSIQLLALLMGLNVEVVEDKAAWQPWHGGEKRGVRKCGFCGVRLSNSLTLFRARRDEEGKAHMACRNCAVVREDTSNWPWIE